MSRLLVNESWEPVKKKFDNGISVCNLYAKSFCRHAECLTIFCVIIQYRKGN